MNEETAITTPGDASLAELRGSLAGAVIGPADAGYDVARRGFNALVDRRPACIARCLGPADVATAFDFARAHSMEVAVRGGGHNPAGHCVCDGGLVIDLSSMRRVEVDAEAGIARAQGGATWLDFDSATQAHGLVTPGGVVVSFGGAGVREALQRFREVVSQSPRELSCKLTLGVDESLSPVVGVIPCYTGSNPDPEDLRVIRSGGGVLDDGVRP